MSLTTAIPPKTWVILDLPEPYLDYQEYYENLLGVKNKDEKTPIFVIGEMKSQPDHYIVETRTGKEVCGLHPELFKVVDHVQLP